MAVLKRCLICHELLAKDGECHNRHEIKMEKSKPKEPEEPEALPIMKFFDYKHLPDNLQVISGEIYKLAWWFHTNLPNNAEKSAGLRKLLEAKDCFVRANL